MRVTILGCGTSGGVPSITGYWGACDPSEPKNRRTRASVAVEVEGKTFIIDTSPDLRQQCLANNISRVDAVLYTHDHADHVHGIDDLRHLSFVGGRRMPVYGNAATLDVLRQRFPYIFTEQDLYPAICASHVIEPGRVGIDGIGISVFNQQHGPGISLGFRIGDFAYSTDVNGLDERAFSALKGVKLWVVDALRYAPHPTHAHLDLTLQWIARIKPETSILTHLGWEMDYPTLIEALPAGVAPAYDGMVLAL